MPKKRSVSVTRPATGTTKRHGRTLPTRPNGDVSQRCLPLLNWSFCSGQQPKLRERDDMLLVRLLDDSKKQCVAVVSAPPPKITRRMRQSDAAEDTYDSPAPRKNSSVARHALTPRPQDLPKHTKSTTQKHPSHPCHPWSLKKLPALSSTSSAVENTAVQKPHAAPQRKFHVPSHSFVVLQFPCRTPKGKTALRQRGAFRGLAVGRMGCCGVPPPLTFNACHRRRTPHISRSSQFNHLSQPCATNT